MLCPIIFNSNTIELTILTSCYWVLDLLCVRKLLIEQEHTTMWDTVKGSLPDLYGKKYLLLTVVLLLALWCLPINIHARPRYPPPPLPCGKVITETRQHHKKRN